MSRLIIDHHRELVIDDEKIMTTYADEWVAAQLRGQSREDFIKESVGELTGGGMDDSDWPELGLVKLDYGTEEWESNWEGLE